MNDASTAARDTERSAAAAVRPHDVLIVGAGPAGLAAAVELRRAGVRDVVVLEREQTAGGVPRHCGHAGFGWREFRRVLSGPAYAKRLVQAADGIDVRAGHSVTRLHTDGRVDVATPRGLATLHAHRVLLALGTRELPRAARLVSGTRPWGVLTTGALQQMVYLAGQRPCTRAVIVGTELVSFSNLLTMRHAGIRPLAMIESRERTVVPTPAAWIARAAFGVRVITRAEVVAIHGTRRVEAVEIAHADGRTETIDCDGVVFSGRFVPETAIVRPSHVAVDPRSGGPRVDQYGRTSDPTVFAAGNLLRPVEASWTAWDEGRRVARALAASLHGALPVAERHVTIETVDPVRWVCPQQLALPAPLPAALPLNVRVASAVRGRLSARTGSRALWSDRRLWLPERRTLIPLDAREVADASRIDIVLEAATPAATTSHG